jgi:lipoprotein-anchoring transpeptidase ErfK/SrfK
MSAPRLAAGAGIAALFVGVGAAAWLSLAPAAPTTSTPAAKPSSARVVMARASLPKPAIVATARGRVLVYHRPGARKAFVHYTASNGFGQPRVFLVAARIPSWEKVYLPMRPNGTTGWVRDRSVTLSYDPYRVVVSLGGHTVKVYDSGRLFLASKAGVGRSVSSTPLGTYFLVMLLKQPDPSGVYGPYAFGTSAFSTTYYHFGGGPGEIGLHGTDYPQGLGTNVSHGCIRISNAAIARLAKLLPLGTPVEIVK